MQIWEEFLTRQEVELGAETTKKWLRSLKVLHYDACNLYLEAKDSFHVLWFEEHVRPRLATTLVNNNHKQVQVHLTLAQEAVSVVNTKKPKSKKSSIPQLNIVSDLLNPTMLLENFIVSEPNQITYRFVCELATAASSLNPVFIHGAPETGKTHLLTALAHALGKLGQKVFFAHAESFTAHVVSAIRNGMMKEFRKAYREADVLLIDDIHLLAWRTATQEEFFHTFNALYLSKKQMIFTGRMMPQQIEGMEPRLTSRFEWGIVLPLERCDQIKNEKAPVVDGSTVVQKVAEYYGIRNEDILGKSQRRECSQPRQMAMFLCRKELKMAFPQIAKLFLRDHSTVMTSVRAIEKKIEAQEKDLCASHTEIVRMIKS